MRSWDPFRELDQLRREIDRALERGGVRQSPFWRNAFLPARSARAYPLLNISEDSENIYVEALAPGVQPDSLDLSVVGNKLTISGEKPPINGGVRPEAFHRNERAAGKFIRTVELATEVDDARVSANYQHGILRITLPKAEAANPKHIKVNVS